MLGQLTAEPVTEAAAVVSRRTSSGGHHDRALVELLAAQQPDRPSRRRGDPAPRADCSTVVSPNSSAMGMAVDADDGHPGRGRRRRAATSARSALSAISSEKANTAVGGSCERQQPLDAARAGLLAEGQGDEVLVAERDPGPLERVVVAAAALQLRGVGCASAVSLVRISAIRRWPSSSRWPHRGHARWRGRRPRRAGGRAAARPPRRPRRRAGRAGPPRAPAGGARSGRRRRPCVVRAAARRTGPRCSSPSTW